MLAAHRLSRADLRALATGRGQAAVVRRLRAAELSKHRIFLAALMREAARTRPSEYAATLGPAYRLLACVEKRDGDLVTDLIASPQFGGWASDCFRRLSMPESSRERLQIPPLWIDLGQLAVFAGTAALRAGCPFELDVPLRRGAVTFPDFGTARPGADREWDRARVRLGTGGARIDSPLSTVRIPPGHVRSATCDGWSAIPRLAADCEGLRLGVTLDDRDPFLDHHGGTRVSVSDTDMFAWQRLLSGAWAILVGGHRPVAEMIASVLRTLVPLARPAPTRSTSSTATSTFGAIALSLPEDPLAMAESLTHEFQHAVLSAATDLTPMTRAGTQVLTYAPWRDDPRPIGVLLQGIYAHYGVAGFWRRQRRLGQSPAERLRANVEFARWRANVAEAADLLADSGVLSGDGRELVSALRAELATWQGEQVPGAARKYARDLGIDHRVRWRLRHTLPDSAAIDSLATAWRRGAPSPASLTEIGSVVRQGPLPSMTDGVRSYMLRLRYRDPDGFLHGTTPGTDPADIALARGEHTSAADGYRRRIAAGTDLDAWAGLAVALAHTGPAAAVSTLSQRPEVAAALYDQLRDSGPPDPGQIAAWLARPDRTVAR